MKKFIVETYYTCTFKTVHKLDNLNDQELSKIDSRTDGDVQVIDVKLNNRKTKKVGEKKDDNNKNFKINNPIINNLSRNMWSAVAAMVSCAYRTGQITNRAAATGQNVFLVLSRLQVGF